MIIPRNERKRIINEFVTQIMKKLRVPDEYWRIEYTPTLTHPTAYVKWVGTEDSSKWQYRDMSEAIKYAYLKDYIKTEIVQVPESPHPYSLPNLRSLLNKSSTGVVSHWTNKDNDWLLMYLAQREGIDFWMREDGGYDDEGGVNKYLIYKVIMYGGASYIAVLNTRWGYNMWCNLYLVKKTHQLGKVWKQFDRGMGEPIIPIVIVPFSRSKSLSFINWDKKPWSDVK